MKAIKISDEAYRVISLLAKQVDMPISKVASLVIVNKDKQIRMAEKTVSTLIVESSEVTR